MQTNKEFKAYDRNNEETTFIFKIPNSQDLGNADMYYASKIAKLVRKKGNDKLLLRCEVDEFLREQGIWSDSDQKKLDDINARIDEGLSRLRKGGILLSEGRRISIEITEARQEMVALMQKRQIFDNATIEALADEEKIDYLIHACVILSDSGEKYWNSFEDMKEDKSSDVYQHASAASIEVLYGIDSDFEKNLPENKWLKKYKFIDESLNFVDRKTGEFVDRDGRLLSEVEQEIIDKIENLAGDIEASEPFIDDYEVEEKKEKPKKKTTRKRKTTTRKKKVETEAVVESK